MFRDEKEALTRLDSSGTTYVALSSVRNAKVGLAAAKMEALGRLAGGVAHDINNVLTVILGSCQLMMMDELIHDEPAREKILTIQRASKRVADLVSQLLIFSRRQSTPARLVNLNSIFDSVRQLLPVLMGEDVKIEWSQEPGLANVRANPAHMERIIMNLAVNARDAMPNGGRLTLKTANVHWDEEYCRKHANLQTGQYVMVSAADTGCGMTPEVLSHIFEPFYTTKEVGKGTGLGLSTVHGIVHQIGGHITVVSTPGRGATFTIYLPASQDIPEPEADNTAQAIRGSGFGTILVVEDEPVVRKVIVHVLASKGYTVREAADAEHALNLIGQDQSPIDMLLTDLVMPGMSGFELAQHIATRYQDIKVLYMSGYGADVIAAHGVDVQKINFIEKPFLPDALAARVGELLTPTKTLRPEETS